MYLTDLKCRHDATDARTTESWAGLEILTVRTVRGDCLVCPHDVHVPLRAGWKPDKVVGARYQCWKCARQYHDGIEQDKQIRELVKSMPRRRRVRKVA